LWYSLLIQTKNSAVLVCIYINLNSLSGEFNMSINQIVAAVSSIVAVAREQAAEAAGRSYGAEREYAKALNEHFDTLSVAWFTIEHNAKGAEAELVHAEKRAYFKALNDKHPTGKYPNPSVPFARVRKYAQEELAIAFGTDEAEADTEAEGSGNARHTRSLTLRLTEDLSGCYKAGKRAERDGLIQTKEAEALVHIASALGALGIDIAQL
jgi:hypothetical protein